MLALEDIAKDGPFASVVDRWTGDPLDDCLALSVLAAVHMLGLTHKGGAEAVFPSTGGDGRLESGFETLRDATLSHRAWIQELVQERVQTNEVGRAAALFAGIAWASYQSGLTGIEFDAVELGASAGLLLGLDWYRYRLGPYCLGDPESELSLAPQWLGQQPHWLKRAAFHVSSRTGCDLRPRNVSLPDDRLRLKSYIWPDQTARHERFDQAVRVASRRGGITVHGLGADTFVRSALMPLQNRERVLPILSSMFCVYVNEQELRSIYAALQDFSKSYREVWWISLENANGHADLAWRRYVGDDVEEAKLAHCEYQGHWIRWLLDESPYWSS